MIAQLIATPSLQTAELLDDPENLLSIDICDKRNLAHVLT